jgi:MFS transporter, FHS family, glucose/mannose:H+ symporter
MTQQTAASNNKLKYLLYFGFLLSGISTVLIGPVLPFLKVKFVLTDLELAYFFPMQFFGSILGTFTTTYLSKRYGFMLPTIIGSISMAFGVLLMSFDSIYLCWAGFLLNGFGVGLTLPSINMLILEMNPLTISSSLNILNFFWGVGAIISSPFINYFKSENNIFLPMTILCVSFLFLVALISSLGKITAKQTQYNDDSIDFSTPIWSNPIAWLIAAFNFIHVGFETAMGGWLPIYTQRIDADAIISWLPPITLYFLFFVIGRGVAPFFFRFFSDSTMLLLSLAVVFVGLILCFSTANGVILSVGAAVAGFGTSSIFPTNFARFSKTFGSSASRRATPFFVCGTLGAAFATWLIGFMSNYFNDLRSGLSILFASCVVLIVLQIILTLKSKRIVSELG